MTPDRLAGVGGGVVRDQLQAVRARGGGAQVQPAERQAGRAQVDMTVHESRRDEATVEVHHLGARELAAAHLIAAQPGNETVAHRHGGGVGVGRAVHPAVYQQRRRAHRAKLRRGAEGNQFEP